jgi:hypothetical protein
VRIAYDGGNKFTIGAINAAHRHLNVEIGKAMRDGKPEPTECMLWIGDCAVLAIDERGNLRKL